MMTWSRSIWIGILVLGCVRAVPQHQAEEDLPRDHGNSIEDKIGLPIYTTLNGSITNLNEINSKIHLNRTKAFLNCSQGSMQVELMFMEAFYGIAYADFDRNSACMTKGRGQMMAKIELPLKGCGTKQDPARVFTNNIVVRFHPSLEMDGDEVITIVCRYPPAVALRPGPDIPAPIKSLPPPVPALTGLHILLIICSLVFLTLLLTGLGCSYMCLRNRVIATEIHRQTIAGSEITKFSGSTFSHISMFTGYKIPRALVSQQTYGSEAHLVMEHSDTLPSDYPSESHSEVDEERSLPVSSAGSYENKAFIHQQSEQRTTSSLYSENINEIEQTSVNASKITTYRSLEPKFDVQMRVKHAPAPPSPMPSESDASVALERNLTTILEREETTRTTLEGPASKLTTFSYTPEIHAPPNGSRQQTPPVYSRILRKQATEREQHDEVTDSSTRREDETYLKTVTEKMTIEEIERHRRLIKEYRTKQHQDPKWDVTIRNYPGFEAGLPEWENFSDVSSTSNLTLLNEKTEEYISDVRTHHPTYLARPGFVEESSSTSRYSLERVLEPQFASELNEQERSKWREIITSESTLKTLLSEATVKEDYESIKRDSRYEDLFPPSKWDVIIRILAPPGDKFFLNEKSKLYSKKNGGSSTKSQDWETRSRRSSLPTLYEYDSDGGASSRNQGADHFRHVAGQSVANRIRKLSSGRGAGSEADLRSMSEMTVRDFAVRTTETCSGRPDDCTSLSSFDGESLVRSLSQPSLARSATEFTEQHWSVPSRQLPNWAMDELCSSAESTPRPSRKVERVEDVYQESRDELRPGNYSTFTRSTRYSEETYHGTKPPSNLLPKWLNSDSEPEMQI